MTNINIIKYTIIWRNYGVFKLINLNRVWLKGMFKDGSGKYFSRVPPAKFSDGETNKRASKIEIAKYKYVMQLQHDKN
jgi:hypothetical protein